MKLIMKDIKLAFGKFLIGELLTRNWSYILLCLLALVLLPLLYGIVSRKDSLSSRSNKNLGNSFGRSFTVDSYQLMSFFSF